MNLQDLTENIQSHTAVLFRETNRLSEEVFHTNPSPAKWSAAEVLAHLYILESSVNKIIRGNTTICQRNAEEKVKLIQEVFSNKKKKYQAPAAIIPKKGVINTKSELLYKLNSTRSELIRNLHETDLRALCLDFSHPQLGELTRFEWGNLVLNHSVRHLEQLKKVIAAVS